MYNSKVLRYSTTSITKKLLGHGIMLVRCVCTTTTSDMLEASSAASQRLAFGRDACAIDKSPAVFPAALCCSLLDSYRVTDTSTATPTLLHNVGFPELPAPCTEL